MDPDRLLSFDRYSLDLANERLLHDGEVVPLTPKAFAVLRQLVEDAGQLVRKDDLLRSVWRDTHVSDGALRVIVLEIRRALDDDSDQPRFIETVPRRGYRFIAQRARRTSRRPAGADTHATLVGRDGVMAALETRFARACAGERQLVFLSGEAGIGKTTVLDAFVERAAREPDVMIARGACLEHYGVAEAYLPVLEAIGRLLREPGSDRAIRLLEKYAPTWVLQLPWLAPRDDREALRRELVGVTKERMLREMSEALEALTTESALVLVLEDLHWSDHSTLDLLGMLARREETARLLVLGSYRPVDVIVAGHPLQSLLQELRVRRQCDDVALPFLDESAVAAYLAQRFGAATSTSDLAGAVHLRTDGNPLFMVRLADELVAVGVLVEDAGRWRLRGPLDDVARAVPESLRALIDKQIGRLGPEAQRVLEVAGVLGDQFTAGAIAAGLGDDPTAVEEQCDTLARQRQLVVPGPLTTLPDGTSIAQYAFTHNLYPQVLGARVPAARRMRLHQRIGDWLERAYGTQADVISTQLAWHFEEGRDYRRAIRYLISTAESTAGRFAYRDAIRVLQRALALAANVDAGVRPAIEIEILERIGDAHYWLGAMVECAKTYQEEATRAAEAGLVSAQIRALTYLAWPFGLIDPDQGIAAVEQAAQLSAGCDDPLLHAGTELLAGSTRLWYDRWREEDWTRCASARQRIDDLSEAGLPPYHRMIYAHLEVLRGNYGEALRELEAGIATVNEPTSMKVNFFAHSGKTLALLLSGRWGELMRVLRAGKEIAERNSNAPWLFIFREAWFRTVALDFAGARALCDSVIRETTEYPTGQPQTIAKVASAYAQLGNLQHADALQTFAQVLDPATTPKFFLHWYWRMNAQLGLADAWLAAGNLRNARTEADRFLDAASSTSEPNLLALASDVEARVAMVAKDWKRAERHIESALAIVSQYDIPTTGWRVHATRADLARCVKDATAAEHHRARAEELVLALADSFDSDEPLRHTFLSSPGVRRLGRGRAGSRRVAARDAKH
jgi:DNA-binding winged helix-turn-helix (wHTH) protein/tetratricopeptide (TPR) repeat protein